MKSKLAKLLLCLAGMTVLLTGCYREEIDQLKQQIGDLNVKTLEEQISSMKSSVSDLKQLQEQLGPVVDELTKEKQKIETELASVKSQVGDISTASAETQAKVAELSDKLVTLDASIKILESVNIEDRIKEINEQSKKLKEGITTLDNARILYASADELAKISATVEAIAEAFDSNFDKALDRCKDKIIGWISDDPSIKALFDEYYTKSEVDAKLELINLKNEEQDEAIEELGESLEKLSTELKNLINSTISGEIEKLDKKYEEQIKAIGLRIDDIDKVITKILEEYIGDMTTLKIETNLVSAINAIYDKFGTFDGTVESILTALKADVKLLYAADSAIRNGAADSVSLNSLNNRIKTLASITSVQELKTAVGGVQKTLDSLVTQKAFDEAIAAYLTKEDASETYATALALNNFLATYNEVVGDKTSPAAGSILARIAILGNGSFTDNWVTDLTTAVNTLHGLVGTSSVSDQAESIAEGIVNDFVKQILADSEATADSLKTLLSGFNSSIETLGTNIGDMSKLGSDPDIATALANIKTTLSTLDATYAAKTHTHTCSEITDFTTELTSAIKAITGVLTELKTNAKETLVAAINELVDTLKHYQTPEQVEDLITEMEGILAGAIMNGGTDFNAYFKDLNLTVLDTTLDAVIANIGEIVAEGTGTIDSRVSAAIAALNIEDYLKIEDIDDYGFLKAADVDTAALTALKALKVTLGSKEFTYKELDKAIKEVCDSVGKYVSNYSNLLNEFNTLAGRCDAIEAMIGGTNIFSADSTIAETIENIVALFGDLGTDNTVEGLVNTLNGLYSDLINALVGKTSGGSVEDIDSNNNLNALKKRLDTLGLDNINAGSGKSLKTVLGEINSSITDLTGTIGGTYSSTNTVAAAIEELMEALGGITDDKYKTTISTIQADIEALRNACAGKASGGTIDDIKTLVASLKDIEDTFTNFEVNTKKGIKAILEDLDSRASEIDAIIGDVTDTLETADSTFKIEGTLAEEILKIKALISNDAFWEGRISSYSDLIKRMSGVADIESKIGNILNLNSKLWNGLSTNLVFAVNKLYDQITAVGKTDYATKHQLDSLGKALLGIADISEREGIEYKTIKELSGIADTILGLVGDKPTGAEYNDLYDAIGYLESTLSEIAGEKPEALDGYPDTIWEALAALKADIDAMSGEGGEHLLDLLTSFVFIPEYTDGTITYCDKIPEPEKYTNITLNFAVNASSSFDIEDYTVEGIEHGVKTRASGDETIEFSDVVYDEEEGILSVTFSGTDLKLFNSNNTTSVAVRIAEEGGQSYVSEYVVIKRVVGGYYTLTPDGIDNKTASYKTEINNKHIVFGKVANSTQVFTFSNTTPGQFEYEVELSGCSGITYSKTDSDMTLTVKTDGTATFTGGTMTITNTKTGDSVEYTIDVVDPKATFSGPASTSNYIWKDATTDPVANAQLYTKKSQNNIPISVTYNFDAATLPQDGSIKLDGFGDGYNSISISNFEYPFDEFSVKSEKEYATTGQIKFKNDVIAGVIEVSNPFFKVSDVPDNKIRFASIANSQYELTLTPESTTFDYDVDVVGNGISYAKSNQNKTLTIKTDGTKVSDGKVTITNNASGEEFEYDVTVVEPEISFSGSTSKGEYAWVDATPTDNAKLYIGKSKNTTISVEYNFDPKTLPTAPTLTCSPTSNNNIITSSGFNSPYSSFNIDSGSSYTSNGYIQLKTGATLLKQIDVSNPMFSVTGVTESDGIKFATIENSQKVITITPDTGTPSYTFDKSGSGITVTQSDDKKTLTVKTTGAKVESGGSVTIRNTATGDTWNIQVTVLDPVVTPSKSSVTLKNSSGNKTATVGLTYNFDVTTLPTFGTKTPSITASSDKSSYVTVSAQPNKDSGFNSVTLSRGTSNGTAKISFKIKYYKSSTSSSPSEKDVSGIISAKRES